MIACAFHRGNLPAAALTGAAAFFDTAIGVMDTLGHPVLADREMYEAALRLRSPIALSRHLDLAHCIGLTPHPGCVDVDRNLTQDRMCRLVHLITLAPDLSTAWTCRARCRMGARPKQEP